MHNVCCIDCTVEVWQASAAAMGKISCYIKARALRIKAVALFFHFQLTPFSANWRGGWSFFTSVIPNNATAAPAAAGQKRPSAQCAQSAQNGLEAVEARAGEDLSRFSLNSFLFEQEHLRSQRIDGLREEISGKELENLGILWNLKRLQGTIRKNPNKAILFVLN